MEPCLYCREFPHRAGCPNRVAAEECGASARAAQYLFNQGRLYAEKDSHDLGAVPPGTVSFQLGFVLRRDELIKIRMNEGDWEL